MSGFDDLVNQGKGLYEQHKDKIGEFLKSEQAEEISDKVLDGASGVAKKVVPEQHHDKIDDVRGNIDGAVGNQ
ncbi:MULTISPECIES: Rv0909 family putative TA system antitoxin [Microbacterium]|uniref:Rv0909 family putative TA system antitoxin n=1 Tax=Microbacterium TaxID=33882 RepID=UPI000D65EE40|nr:MULTISPECIES: Rv0909 family putative TA system antitoxin [Microbacterium]